MRTKIIITLVLVVSMVAPLGAHSPEKIVAKFDPESQLLMVGVIHQVEGHNNPWHYIKKIIISINHEAIFEDNLTRQRHARGVVSYYFLPRIKKGDKIKIEAFDVKEGYLSKEIEAE